jgi:hypothetical protein
MMLGESVALHVPVAGSNSSALYAELLLKRPTAKTLPFASSVVELEPRIVLKFPVGRHWPVVGLYNSADVRGDSS